MSTPDPTPLIAEALRELHSGNPERALDCARRAIAADPASAPAHYAAAAAHATLGASAAALAEFRRAAELQPAFAPAHFGVGWMLRAGGRPAEAIAPLTQALALDARDPQWHVELASALIDMRRVDAANDVVANALRTHGQHAGLLRLAGQLAFLRGDLEPAAAFLGESHARDPADAAVPMFLMQAELLLGRWPLAWTHYAFREQRRRFEAERARHGLSYTVPTLDAIAGERVTLVAEQGLGDVLFFLRFARELQVAGVRLELAGDARLLPLLARTRLFDSLRASTMLDETRAERPILVGDLPMVSAHPEAPFAPSLEIVPENARTREWTRRLEAAGPRPWIGVTWRAGTPADVLAHGLHKTISPTDLMTALRPLGGTVVALQRGIRAGELDAARAALGATVHDFSAANDDLEDALALVALLDRHVGVSNTNMHLAAAAGATADVLVPYPPEWRWRRSGESPWFPGFRVHRQSPDSDWSGALAGLTP